MGDLFNEGLYDIHIELKHIPLLGWEPSPVSYKACGMHTCPLLLRVLTLGCLGNAPIQGQGHYGSTAHQLHDDRARVARGGRACQLQVGSLQLLELSCAHASVFPRSHQAFPVIEVQKVRRELLLACMLVDAPELGAS